MSGPLTIHEIGGVELDPWLDALGGLRIRVFREFPYLYDGTLDYERDFLEIYQRCARSRIVLVTAADGSLIGATTCMPLADEAPEFQKPFVDEGGLVRNRCPIISEGRQLHQDKIHLTPCESAFDGDGPIRIRDFRGPRGAVVICLDVEIPEVSAALRGMDLDLILIPSAIESLLGVERVGRCAAARAVELGCHVAICHLVSRMESELIDENIGRLAAFSPSQSAFLRVGRQTSTEVFAQGFQRMAVSLDIAALRENRATHAETDPSKIRPAVIGVEF